ncbi:MAG TPA: DUF3141 domain-containing protein [Thiopseudomonas sp.]|nr:DUF3141 domain-containing protein [Thiopseudomonas sp.]
MSDKSFFTQVEERFSSFQALLKHLGQLQRLQFDNLLTASSQRYTATLSPMREGQLRQPSPTECLEYWVDFCQRSLLYLDALRQRGDNTLAHEAAGYPLLLKFPYETLIDGRDLPRPVNYSLLKIISETEQPNNSERAPVIVIDPRGGHGAGIGGFKQDSAVGESLRAGHPTYFIAFSHSPESGQTLHDVGVAQAGFLEEVIQRHPNAEKPIVIGNCQAGWALMGLAAARPELPGLVIINGAPLSYWSGEEGNNPMRYSGGLLGGAWLTRLASDLGNGRFDGAWLVSNFEALNPANTYWNKYYNLFSNIDSEVPRFLDFERWWGSPTLLNREEIEMIVDDLFIGNRLTGGLGAQSSEVDLKKIEAPVVVFCSYGDDITPPQQALNWIADIYPSDLALRKAGRTIIYLKHANVGHLGIFVSGAVARREHRELLDASEAIGLLAPGLYEMIIEDVPVTDESEPSYEVYFEPRRITDILSDDNSERERDDEREFAMVNQVSQVNSTLYESFVRPWMIPAMNEHSAEMIRKAHPFRMQQYFHSSLNPIFSWLAGSAPVVRANRQPVSPNNPLLAWQENFSNLVETQLNVFRDVRDASQEMKFHTVYGALATLTGMQKPDTQQSEAQLQDENVTEHLRDSLTQGGGLEALSRILLLLGHESGKFSKARVQQMAEKSRSLMKEFDMDFGNIRQIIDQQGLLVFALPAESLATLPQLLVDNEQRKVLLETVMALVPELLIAEGAVGELWRQLHQLFEQPIPAFVQPKLSTSSVAVDKTEPVVPVKKTVTPVKAVEKKAAQAVKPKTAKAAAKKVAKPAVAPKAVTADKEKTVTAQASIEKPSEPAKKEVAQQQELPVSTAQAVSPKADQAKSAAVKGADDKLVERAEAKAAPVKAAVKKPLQPVVAPTPKATVAAQKDKITAVQAPVEKTTESVKPQAESQQPALAKADQDKPAAKASADKLPEQAQAEETKAPIKTAVKKPVQKSKRRQKAQAKKQEQLASTPEAKKDK